MNHFARVWRSSVGKKFVMALTGAVLFVFVLGHLLGNLQLFLGPETLNRYGHFLQSNKEILWLVRAVLLACVVLHILAAARLSAENKAARPVGYLDDPNPIAASYASRTMLMSGLIVAAFIVYHLLHYTVQVTGVNFSGQDFGGFHDEKGRHDVYRMMIIGFQQPIVALFYVGTMALLCLHLSHGTHAMFQSLGVRVGCCPELPRRAANWGALVIFLGYVSMPLAVMSGFGRGYAAGPIAMPVAKARGRE
jgi:succinate dehydrogenase / fumarate reductase cytochrome b subunit